MSFVSSRGGAPPVSLSRSHRAGTGAGRRAVCPERLPPVDCAALRRHCRACRTWPAPRSQRFLRRATAAAAACSKSPTAALDIPAPTTAVDGVPRSAVCARALSRPDGRVQGFRRAIPGREPAAAASAGSPQPLTILVATSGDTGGAVAAAFHRRAVGAGRDSLPEGTGEPAPGTAADLLGRECAVAARRRHL